MAFILADRVKETSTSIGTGDFTLAGAATGFQTFDAALNTGDTTYYCIEAIDGTGAPSGAWEVGLGTFTSPSTLARTTVLASSNAGSAVNFSAGTKNVFITAPGAKHGYFDKDVTLESTDAGASAGPILTLYRDSASPAASDVIGQIKFDGEDSAGNQQTYASIQSVITDATSTSEDAHLRFSVVVAGTVTEQLELTNAAFRPTSDDTLILGGPANGFKDFYLANGANINWNNGDVTISHSTNSLSFSGATNGYNFDDDVNVSGGTIFPAIGSTTVAPIKFQSGTNLTTAEAGAMEYDGTCLYGTVDAGNRGVIGCEQVRYVVASTALTNTTNDQQLFPTNGVLTLETGFYVFEALLSFAAMSATSGNLSYSTLGTGTATCTHLWYSEARDAAANGTPGNCQEMFWTNATSSASIATAATATTAFIRARGAILVTGAGTIIPTINLVTAAAATLEAGSYFRIKRVGPNAATAVGQWT